MALDFFAKYGIILGVITILASFSPILSFLYQTGYACFVYFSGEATEVDLTLGPHSIIPPVYFIFSCLLIYGIIKKHHRLLIPWLVTTFLFFISIFAYCGEFMYFAPFLVTTVLIVITFCALVVLYPMYVLFSQIRQENAAPQLNNVQILIPCHIEVKKTSV